MKSRPHLGFRSDELITNRQLLTKADPSLPQRAGVAFRKIRTNYDLALEQSQGNWNRFNKIMLNYIDTYPLVSKRHTIRASAVARPEPDIQKLIQAILWIDTEDAA